MAASQAASATATCCRSARPACASSPNSVRSTSRSSALVSASPTKSRVLVKPLWYSTACRSSPTPASAKSHFTSDWAAASAASRSPAVSAASGILREALSLCLTPSASGALSPCHGPSARLPAKMASSGDLARRLALLSSADAMQSSGKHPRVCLTSEAERAGAPERGPLEHGTASLPLSRDAMLGFRKHHAEETSSASSPSASHLTAGSGPLSARWPTSGRTAAGPGLPQTCSSCLSRCRSRPRLRQDWGPCPGPLANRLDRRRQSQRLADCSPS